MTVYHAERRGWWLGQGVFLGAVLAAAVFHWVTEHGSSSDGPSPAVPPHARADSQNERGPDGESAAIAALSARLLALEARMAAQTPHADDATGEPGPTREALPGKTHEQALSKYEEKLVVAAERETLDPEWSSEVLAGARLQAAKLEGSLEVESLRCGTTLCALKLRHKDADAHADFLAAAANNLDETPGFDGPMFVRRHELPGGGFRTAIYLVRDGEQLPPIDNAVVGEP